MNDVKFIYIYIKIVMSSSENKALARLLNFMISNKEEFKDDY